MVSAEHRVRSDRPRVMVAVVEPDTLLRALLMRLVRDAGYVPVTFATYANLTQVFDPTVRAAILDEVADADLAGLIATQVPMIVLTSDQYRTTADWCRVVVKPFANWELIEALDALIAPRHTGQADGHADFSSR